MTSATLKPGDLVVIPWGIDEVRGTVAELYGEGPAARVVVRLTPELSSLVVDEPTTVVMPPDSVRKVGAAAR